MRRRSYNYFLKQIDTSITEMKLDFSLKKQSFSYIENTENPIYMRIVHLERNK